MNGQQARLAGFTIVELLIALIIIGVLTLVAVPVVTNRVVDAKITAAQSDLVSLRKAQEHASFDTNYYYRLHVLNDTEGGDGISFGQPNDRVDGFLDEENNTVVGNPSRIFIDPTDGQLLDTRLANVQWSRIRLNETQFNWSGPYINWQDERFNTVNDQVLDPWGNPYLFFTARGLIQEPAGILVTGTTPVSIPGVVGTFVPQSFDRFTLLSLGPDGVPGNREEDANQIGEGDDIKIQF